MYESKTLQNPRVITFANRAFSKIPQCRGDGNFISLTSTSCFYQDTLLETSYSSLRLKHNKGKRLGLHPAAIPVLPKDILDTYSKYTHFQNMRPSGLEAVVSSRGDKAEACGAWQQSGQINNCRLYSQREKNGAIQEQIHLSLWGFTRVSEKPHGQQSLSAGTQESSSISTDTWCFIRWQKLRCQGTVFRACVLPGWTGLESTWRVKVCTGLPLPKSNGGNKRQGKTLAIFITKWGFLGREGNNCVFNSWPVTIFPHKRHWQRR